MGLRNPICTSIAYPIECENGSIRYPITPNIAVARSPDDILTSKMTKSRIITIRINSEGTSPAIIPIANPAAICDGVAAERSKFTI